MMVTHFHRGTFPPKLAVGGGDGGGGGSRRRTPTHTRCGTRNTVQLPFGMQLSPAHTHKATPSVKVNKITRKSLISK
jgi:hypothetical protein